MLLLGASAFVAWEVGAAHPARLVAQILVGAGLGGLPAALIFDQYKRWRPDFGFLGLMVGFAVGISFGMLGTAAAGPSVPDVARGLRTGWRRRGRVRRHLPGFRHRVHKKRDLLTEPLVIVLAALLIGSFATLGHQICGGGPGRFSRRAGRTG